ncbi:MAG: GIY-YIG nuclease family protein [Synechococcales cyanobacterium RU_4_20]|nr:GIY-YIG nuclease family protein [Synechococcales cyanobacterium RU_4_20]
MLWLVYVIRAGDRSLYVGITTDLQRRFQEHHAQGAKCARYLRGRSPLTLVFSCGVSGQSAALRLERRLKRLSKRQKEELVAGTRTLSDLGVIP